MVRLSRAALLALRSEARRRYPAEACGLLLGRDAGDERWVRRALAVPNGWTGDARTRYRIPAATVAAAEAAAAREGLVVVGAFHSHPDGAAQPSRYDLEHAWPWYTYLILPVSAGETGPPRTWRLADDRSAFLEESWQPETEESTGGRA